MSVMASGFCRDTALTDDSIFLAIERGPRVYSKQTSMNVKPLILAAALAISARTAVADTVETFSFSDVTASEFELVPGFACRVELGSASTVAQVIEKQLGRMHPTPSPTWQSSSVVFFLSNFPKAGTCEATLRVSGKAPEFS